MIIYRSNTLELIIDNNARQRLCNVQLSNTKKNQLIFIQIVKIINPIFFNKLL